MLCIIAGFVSRSYTGGKEQEKKERRTKGKRESRKLGKGKKMSHLAHTQRKKKKKEHRNCKQHLTTTTCPRFPLPLPFPFLSAPSHSNVKDTEALHSQKSLCDCFSRICLRPGNEKVGSVVVGVATSAAGDFFAATQPIIFFLATTGETHTTSFFLSSPPLLLAIQTSGALLPSLNS